MAALRSRLHLALWIVLPPIVFSAILRVVLHSHFADEPTDGAMLRELALGTSIDFLVALALATPVLIGVCTLPLGWLASTWLRGALFAAFYAALAFHDFVEFFFFEEFKARFNHIALDYLLFPGEVVGNIWQSYDVPLFVALAIGAGLLAAGAMLVATRGISFAPLGLKRRIGAAAGALGLGVAAVFVLVKAPLSFANDRLEHELTSNGTLQLVRAFFTGALEYDQYYSTLPRDEARRRAARALGFDAPTDAELAAPKGAYVPRRTGGDAARATSEPHAWNVVVVVEESLGAEFVGELGAERSHTPEFDRWSKEGLLLSGLIANGNRTVRGLEGVLSSFVPLPGDAILKRTKSENVATLARVLRELGWRTEFFYGGRGVFDGMKPFMKSNGWETFFEQSDFPDDVFTTAWGAADEHIFDALLERQREARSKRERLFATLLTVSNHKPYDIPPGNPIYKEGKKSRERAVAYADWALGRWLDTCRDEGLLSDTLVMIVGDHGARVYGAAEIPAGSYRIPALFLAPDPALRGTRQDRLCSQVDLAPTLLGLLGLPTPAPFFGCDVRGLPADGGRAFVHHNRDIGMVTDDALVVLGLQKTVHYYRRAARSIDRFEPVPAAHADEHLHELARDATSVFQLADELYESRNYRLSDAPARTVQASSPRLTSPR